ncbi:MAG: arabinose operon transcriptional regulator AraC [Candidatus Devosia phytovorans]|uniref:Arabinose operon transcriptional regulator AraC n=1 Tax=Candidatus Devosia phytovorans TaxID=3121372 RepID=A0AAJ5VW43_9HYPH|nr:arabinose operon transcriptional regulator AraC [Devosia sp.]WEK05191.1 MAG: arabinose operon transcriptional regulator AraC [Devosia sp.]
MTGAHESPYQATRRLLTGHFHETSGYRAVRRQGVEDWLLVHTISGRGRFSHAGGELIAEAGDWVLLRPGTPHDYGVEPSLQRWELVWAHFRPRADWLDWLNWPAAADGLFHLRVEDGDLARQFIAVHHQLNSPHARREALAVNAFEALLLACDAHNPRPAKAGDSRIARAMDFIAQHLTEKLLIDDIARAVGLSPSRLAHLFRQETAETIQAHIEIQRLHLALDLLRRTSFPIKQIAAHAGFDNQFYFSQRFRRRMGQSPQQFRQSQDVAPL